MCFRNRICWTKKLGASRLAEGAEIVKECVAARGKILVPAFAVGRVQNLLYHLAALFHR